jgi:hypothetical protein
LVGIERMLDSLIAVNGTSHPSLCFTQCVVILVNGNSSCCLLIIIVKYLELCTPKP